MFYHNSVVDNDVVAGDFCIMKRMYENINDYFFLPEHIMNTVFSIFSICHKQPYGWVGYNETFTLQQPNRLNHDILTGLFE